MREGSYWVRNASLPGCEDKAGLCVVNVFRNEDGVLTVTLPSAEHCFDLSEVGAEWFGPLKVPKKWNPVATASKESSGGIRTVGAFWPVPNGLRERVKGYRFRVLDHARLVIRAGCYPLNLCSPMRPSAPSLATFLGQYLG